MRMFRLATVSGIRISCCPLEPMAIITLALSPICCLFENYELVVLFPPLATTIQAHRCIPKSFRFAPLNTPPCIKRVWWLRQISLPFGLGSGIILGQVSLRIGLDSATWDQDDNQRRWHVEVLSSYHFSWNLSIPK